MGALLYKWGPLVTRFLLAPIFIYSGIRKIFDVAGTGSYIQETFIRHLSIGIAGPGEEAWSGLAIAAAVMELGGGFLILAGLRTRLATLTLFGYLAVVTLIFHVIGWAGATDPMAANPQALSLFKNMAIMAALLQLGIYGPGRPSFDIKL